MLVASDRNDRQLQSLSIWIVKRNADGTFNNNSNRQILASYENCNSAFLHPVNGELYFNGYDNG